MTVTVMRGVGLAVRRALAAGAVAACGAGCLAAYGQQAAPAQTLAQAKTTPVTAAGSEVTTAKAATAGAPIVLAQTTPPPPANPANPPASGAEQLQTIVITGSLIARTSVETPSPVQVISEKDLIQSGYTDFSTVLKNISANGASTLSQSFSGAFAAGASGVSLRGLTVGDTLVLVDGERTVPYPLLDDNQRSFVDLASIPFTAIQSVQVDKNGASGVYGSDAIAGVVNVILKKEYQGFKVSAETGTSQRGDGTMEHIGFIGGMGDLASDGYNWYVSGDFRHQDQILARNRSGLWDNLDWRPWGGNFGNAIDNIGASPASSPFFSYPQSITGYLIDPATGGIVDYLPGCSAAAQAANRCLAILPGAQLQPPTTRGDVLAKFTKQLANQWSLGIQASWFNSSSQEVAGYAATGTGNVAGLSFPAFGPGIPFHIVPASSLVTPNIMTIPTSNPMYPSSCDAAADPEKCSWFGSPLAAQYEFPELGASTEQTNTYTYRLLASLDGTAAGWDMHVTAGAMYSKADLHYVGGSIDWQSLQSALNNGYVFGSSGANALFSPTMIATPWSSLDLLDAHGQHELLELPGGPLELAAGVQYVKEVHDEHAPPNAEAGLQAEGGGPVYVIGTQKDAAAFIELDGDPVKHLEIDAAGRFDNYQGVGSALTPQLGVKFTPWRWIGLRGTYGKGFRAPSAAEGGQSGELFGAGAYQDPALCPTATPSGMAAGPGDFPSQCGVFVTGFQQANPHLQNVKSTNWTEGVILQPIEAVSATIDYYNIKVTNDIISAFEAGGLQNFTGLTRGAPVLQQYCPATFTGGCTSGELVNQITPVGLILAATYPYVNAGQTHTTGFDVDLKGHYDAGRLGRLTAEATWTHLLTYQLTFNGNTYELAGTHGPSGVSGDTGSPKDRASLQLSWQKGPLTLAPSVDFVGHFNVTDPSSGVTTCAQGLGFIGYITSGVTPKDSAFCSVGYYLQTDAYGEYQVSANFQLHAAVTNLFNKVPPVDLQTYGAGTYNYPYDPAFEQGGAVGRFFTLGFTYDF